MTSWLTRSPEQARRALPIAAGTCVALGALYVLALSVLPSPWLSRLLSTPWQDMSPMSYP